jgi:FlaA1/EpsC-like NDP-sugar epimerase
MMAGQVLTNMALRTYRMIWRYVSLRDAITLARNYALFPAAFLLLEYVTPRLSPLLRVPVGLVVATYFFSARWPHDLLAVCCTKESPRES